MRQFGGVTPVCLVLIISGFSSVSTAFAEEEIKGGGGVKDDDGSLDVLFVTNDGHKFGGIGIAEKSGLKSYVIFGPKGWQRLTKNYNASIEKYNEALNEPTADGEWIPLYAFMEDHKVKNP